MALPAEFLAEVQEIIKSTLDEMIQVGHDPDKVLDEQDAPVEEPEEEEEPVAEMGMEPPADAAQAAGAAIVAAVADAVDAAAGTSEMEDDEDDEDMPEMDGMDYEDDEEEMESIRLSAVEASLAEMQKAARLQECAVTLSTRINAARLPAPLAELVRVQFTGRAFRTKELDAMITRVKEAATALDPTGRVTGAGGQRGNGGSIQVGMNERDVAEVEFTRLLAGNTRFRNLEHVKDQYVQDRLPESYNAWIRGGRQNYNTYRLSQWVREFLGGDPFADPNLLEASTTSTMSSIVKNALNLLLAADYAVRHQWWTPIVRQEEVDTIDDATLIRVYGLNTLEVVDEGQAYNELVWVDEEETASFVKKGNFVGVTLETLLRDKMNVVRSIPERLATSWYNTISALASGVFTVNTATGPVLGDSGALFNNTAAATPGGHVNLLTTAFSYTAYDAAVTAMLKQTDQTLGAGQRMLAKPKFLLVPPDLRAAALQVRNAELIPGSANNDVNPYYQDFEVVVVPTFTDTNNWAVVADPALFPAIWLIFLRGRAVPELFTADSETQGAMFTNDTMRYKVRMLTWRFSSTYDCLPVSDFRPLHKSNV